MDTKEIVGQLDALTKARAALREIANEPCDHGPGFCPRAIAVEAITAANKLTRVS